MGKAELIERSLRCFVCGLAGLVPLIGLPLAVTAIFEFGHVSLRKGPDWNPADRYLSWGLVAAVFGLLLTLLLALIVISAVV